MIINVELHQGGMNERTACLKKKGWGRVACRKGHERDEEGTKKETSNAMYCNSTKTEERERKENKRKTESKQGNMEEQPRISPTREK
jgi:hypothetical protein